MIDWLYINSCFDCDGMLLRWWTGLLVAAQYQLLLPRLFSVYVFMCLVEIHVGG